MNLSLPTKSQLLKVVKVFVWAGASAVVSFVLAFLAGHPDAFGLFTPLVNAALLAAKQFFTEE